MKDTHVTSDLSAYLDGELSPAERGRVSAHLEACRVCSARLGELRATATLIAALPDARPSRSLVPVLTPRFNWLRPVRSLSAVMSGAFVMVFLITAVAQSGSDLGGGPEVPFGRSVPQAAPAAAPGAPTATSGEEAAAGVMVATPTAAADATELQRMGDAGRETDQGAAPEDATSLSLKAGAPEPPSPLIWLVVSLFLGIVAGFAHWRLRAAVA